MKGKISFRSTEDNIYGPISHFVREGKYSGTQGQLLFLIFLSFWTYIHLRRKMHFKNHTQIPFLNKHFVYTFAKITTTSDKLDVAL